MKGVPSKQMQSMLEADTRCSVNPEVRSVTRNGNVHVGFLEETVAKEQQYIDNRSGGTQRPGFGERICSRSEVSLSFQNLKEKARPMLRGRHKTKEVLSWVKMWLYLNVRRR